MIVFLQPLSNLLVAVSIKALQLSLESYTVFPLSTVMLSKPLQSPNTLMPISVTELGITNDVKPLQPQKAQVPIEVTELGISTDVKPLQPSKADLPIEVTELGMIVFLQPLSRVLVAVSIIALQTYLESYTVFPLSTVMLSKPLQKRKASLPISVTEFGISIDVKPLQP